MPDPDPFAAYASKSDPFAAYATKPNDPVAAYAAEEGPIDRFGRPLPPQNPTIAKLIAMTEPLAHPKTVGDFAALAIPSGEGALVSKGVNAIAGKIGEYGGAAAHVADAALSQVPIVGGAARLAFKTLSKLNPAEWNSPLTVAGREGRAVAASQRFNALPLTEQMKTLPNTPAPITTRGAAPPYQAPSNVLPFHERPLAQQMDSLPDTPAPQGGRLATRPYTAPSAPPPSFQDRPLYQQMQDMTEPPRPIAPIARTQSPPYRRELSQAIAPAVPPPAAAAADAEVFEPRNVERLPGTKEPEPPIASLPVKVQPENAGPMNITEARDLQGELGARDAGAKLGIDPEELRTATGQRGKLPAAAQARIDKYVKGLTADQIRAEAGTTTNAKLKEALLASLAAAGVKP